MKLLIILIIYAWIWRVGFLVTKTRITFMRVFPDAVSWACVLWPMTVADWSFTASSTAAANGLQKWLPGTDDEYYAAARNSGSKLEPPRRAVSG